LRKGETTESSDLEKELSLSNFTPLICVVLFAVLVEYAKNSKDFITLLEAAFVILSFGTLFFFWTSRRAVTKTRRIILTTIAVFSIIVIVLTAYSIAAIPRGGIKHSAKLEQNDMELVLEKAGTYQEGVRYVGRDEQVLFEADYPTSFVRVYSDFDGYILTQKNYSLHGAIWGYLILYPNRINYTFSDPVFSYTLWPVSHNGTRSFFTGYIDVGYGFREARRQMRLDDGYTVALIIILNVYGPDYGESINATIEWEFRWGVDIDDIQVTSSLQDMLMISVASFMAGLFIPYRLIMTKKEETPTAESPEPPPTSNSVR